MKGTLWVLQAQGFVGSRLIWTCVTSALTSLLNKRVALLPTQCYESTAFCLVGFYKNCCKLPLLQMLKLFVFTFLKWNDVTFLEAEYFSSAKGIWQNQAKFLNCLVSLAPHFLLSENYRFFCLTFEIVFIVNWSDCSRGFCILRKFWTLQGITQMSQKRILS